MYDLLMESEERRKERLRCRNQRNRDRRATESTQQREAQLARLIEPIVLCGLLPSGREFWVTGEGD